MRGKWLSFRPPRVSRTSRQGWAEAFAWKPERLQVQTCTQSCSLQHSHTGGLIGPALGHKHKESLRVHGTEGTRLEHKTMWTTQVLPSPAAFPVDLHRKRSRH